MSFVEVDQGPPINGIELPGELYWVLSSPAPLAGMKYPRANFPWDSLHVSGFSYVVSLHPGSYDPAPLSLAFSEKLEDLFHSGAPTDEWQEGQGIGRAVAATMRCLQRGAGVVVHCCGGRGRTGTVLGCVLRDLGHDAGSVLNYLDRVHKTRGKKGWPESDWQRTFMEAWNRSV